jgi:hypothetical protein
MPSSQLPLHEQQRLMAAHQVGTIAPFRGPAFEQIGVARHFPAPLAIPAIHPDALEDCPGEPENVKYHRVSDSFYLVTPQGLMKFGARPQ